MNVSPILRWAVFGLALVAIVAAFAGGLYVAGHQVRM